MFNSYDKEKFKVNEVYYTYYFEITNKGNNIKDYTGILKVRVISNEPEIYYPDGYTEFEILESKKLGTTIAHNIHLYMNGYGSASTNFYTDKEECIKDHDDEIKKISKKQSSKDKELLLKKLIDKSHIPKKSKKEIDAVKWYETLTKKEKEYVNWIKNYWDEI